MSVRMIEQRWCDVCEAEYSDKPDWMILSAANAPAETDAQWDFCSYACLVKWVTTDEVDDAGPDFGVAHDVARTVVSPPVEMAPVSRETPVRSPEELAAAQARMDAAMRTMSEKPSMTLMEALASGKLNFDRSAD